MRKRSLVLLVDDNDAGHLLIHALLELAGRGADGEVADSEPLERLNPRPSNARIAVSPPDVTAA